MLTMDDERMLAKMERDYLEPPADPDELDEDEWLDVVDREVEEAYIAKMERRMDEGCLKSLFEDL